MDMLETLGLFARFSVVGIDLGALAVLGFLFSRCAECVENVWLLLFAVWSGVLIPLEYVAGGFDPLVLYYGVGWDTFGALMLLHIGQYGDRSGFVSGLGNIECCVVLEYGRMVWYTLRPVGIFGFLYVWAGRFALG